jgi:hypothetical protein
VIVYVCRARGGPLFVASDELAEVLDWAAAARLATSNGAWKVNVYEGEGWRAATCDGWRILAYAAGGYSCHQQVSGMTGWWLADDCIPCEMEEALCFALGVPCLVVEVERPWTAEEILEREG